MSYPSYINGYKGINIAPAEPDCDYRLGEQHAREGWPMWSIEEFHAGESKFSTTHNYDKSESGAQREKLSVTPYDLVPFQEITDAYTRVAEHGAKKYAPWNWSLGLARAQLISSLLRHTFSYLRGEERDSDSGLLHTDHILWNAATLSHNVHHGLEDGRRPEPPRDYKNGDAT